VAAEGLDLDAVSGGELLICPVRGGMPAPISDRLLANNQVERRAGTGRLRDLGDRVVDNCSTLERIGESPDRHTDIEPPA